MNPGLLDRKIQIHRNKPTKNDFGEPEDCWEIHLTRRARKMEKAGREYFTNGREISKHAVIFRIHYTEDIETSDRVRYCEKDHDIEDILEIGRREWTDVVCTLRRNSNC